ncbi:hypothetical protein NQ318_021349 [Aromia moschata]|uniref:Uncharacterized protein n=1 Tax=Aromia moschata TaxID=1265417 RepID=A0AAV8ZCT6_9CUCU|nr:hypothetical protein NQ318_021349 [Aromia moschata]
MDIVLVHLMLSCLVCGNSFSHCFTDYSQINKENIRKGLGECFRKYSSMLHLTPEGRQNITTSQMSGTNSFTIHALNVSEFNLFNDTVVVKMKKNNDTVDISFKISNRTEISARKMMGSTNNAMQYMLVPGFLMAGILPWIMPWLQMAVMGLGMVNNMAFTSALFSLVRSYVFEKEPDEHVVYVNHGYRKKKPYRRK